MSDVDEVEDLLESNGYLDVTYVFVQSKTSSNFDTKEMHLFYFGVTDFFDEKPKLPRNDDIERLAELSDQILSNAPSFKENPKCKTYFVTTGVYNEDTNISAAVSSFRDGMESYNLFDSIDNNVLGASEIGRLYRKTKSPVSSTFVFSNKITLPDIDGINQSYYGALPFSEFKKLLIDENNNIHSIFDDNVRDYQGDKNPVNKSISETLQGGNPQLFSVLNNGVAIVANSIKTSGNTFTISDYQIVNGCQTSNVLYANRNNQGIENINIPVRLVVTDDEDVKSKITVSTNNQTAIKKEQLAAMSEFQKNLEHYYSASPEEGRLYYERRAKQYNTDRNVVKKKIITVPVQIKAYSAMFIRNPHMVTSFFGRLIKNIGERGSKIFEPDHQFAPYYLAALAHYRLEGLLNAGTIDKRYKKAKFHILMLLPLIASSEELPPINSQKKAEKFCSPIIEKLNDEAKCKEIFTSAVKIIDSSGADIEDKQALKSRSLTDRIFNSYDGTKV